MIFKKINDDTIRCIVENEEMKEFGVTMKDFFEQSDRMHQFVEMVLQKAWDAVGFRQEGSILALQIAKLPSDRVMLTISQGEKLPQPGAASDPSNQDPSGYQKMMEEVLGDSMGEFLGMLEKKIAEQKMGKKSRDEKKRQRTEEDEEPLSAVFFFDNLTDVARLADALPYYDGESSLYKNEEGGYDLILKPVGSSLSGEFRSACVRAMEFGHVTGAGAPRERMVREHGKLLIEKDALEKIRQ